MACNVSLKVMKKVQSRMSLSVALEKEWNRDPEQDDNNQNWYVQPHMLQHLKQQNRVKM